MRPTIALAIGLLVAAAAPACAPALRPLPPDTELGDLDPGDADPEAASRLMAEAREAFAERPDPEAVERAAGLYLQAARAAPTSPEPLVGTIRAQVWLAERVDDSDRRRRLATSAVRNGQWCEDRAPAEILCDYWLALAVGVQADARRSTARDGLRVMVERLHAVIEERPDLDHAGPHRVLARVLVNAPGWPTGPGDPDEGLEHAREAVRRFPEHPPNLLVLGEALRELDRNAEARDAYARALEAARRARAEGVPEAAEWLRRARDGLEGLR